MDDAARLAGSLRASVVAPAGCGKTHLIAQAVAQCCDGRQLVLTHTHAGVDALRRKMVQLGAPLSRFRIETIDGWCLRYALAFPVTSSLATLRPTGDEWHAVHAGLSELLRHAPVARVVRASYCGVFVDEYQDCTVQQHKVIVQLARIIPCRILGDPLQGIFGFGDNVLVDWNTDVVGAFEPLPPLTTPWRWRNANSALGEWLLSIRSQLEAGQEIGLNGAPLEWRPHGSNPQAAQVSACFSRAKTNESAAAIHQWAPQCHRVSSYLKGAYTSVEPIDCEDLIKAANRLDESQGGERAAALIEFAAQCMTTVRTEMTTIRQLLLSGRRRAGYTYRHQEQLDVLTEVAVEASLRPVPTALRSLRRLPNAVLYRRELFEEMERAARECARGQFATLTDAVWHVRDRTRHAGRRLGLRVVGRTLLLKGLEFDHCIVLDADQLDRRNLYVALTRGSRSLTVLSKAPVLRPAP